MPTISAPDLALLRQSYHKQTQYLSVFRPETVLTATVNGSFDAGSMSINFNSGVGDINLVKAGMTLIVSTDIGLERIRIRGISGTTASGTLNLAINSINWASGQVLTIKQEYILWPRLPKFDTSGNFWKDTDIAYTDQTESTKTTPVAIMGSHRAKFRTGASVVFNLDGTDSYATSNGGSISSYLWESTTGTIASATSGTTTLTFTSDYPDGVIVSLTVTDSFGNSQITHRVYFVHNPDPTHADHPVTDFEFESLPTGSWDSGGWKTNIRVSEDADINQFPDGSLVVLWEDTIFGDTTKFISTSEEVKLAGYLRSESIKVDDVGYRNSSFQITTVEALLRNHSILSVVLEFNNSPSTWYHYNRTMNTGKALHFYWKWHSTLFEISDVFLDVTSGVLRKYTEFQEGNLYQAAASISEENGEFMRIASNKAGQIYVEIDIQLLSDTDRAAKTTVAEIEEYDRQGLLTLNRTDKTDVTVARVFLSGFAFDGTTNSALESYAPGKAYHPFGGTISQVERQTLDDQDDANMKSGRVLASSNNTFKDVRLTFKGNWGGYLDIVPQEWWTLSLIASDTNRGVVWNNEKLVPREISYQANNGVYFPEVSFEKEALGEDGVAGDYVNSVPDTGGSSSPTTSTEGYITSSSVYTRLSGAATWTLKTAEATSCLTLDPYWKVIQATDNPESCILLRGGVGYIKRSVDAGTVWNDITPDDPPNSYGDATPPTAADLTFQFIESDVDTSGTFFVAANWENPSGGTRSWLLKTIDSGVNWGYTSEWWLSGGLSSSDCVAAYQAVDATSFANSLVNLNDPGTNDLVSSGSDPSLTADGWEFTGSEQIDSIITPDENTSIFICVSDLAVPDFDPPNIMAIAGTERASDTSFNFYYSQYYGVNLSVKSESESLLAYGSKKGTMAGVLIGSNRVYYANGVAISTESSVAFTSSQPFSLGAYTGYTGVPIYPYLTGTIKALAIYSRTFTESEALAIQASMMALFGD